MPNKYDENEFTQSFLKFALEKNILNDFANEFPLDLKVQFLTYLFKNKKYADNLKYSKLFSSELNNYLIFERMALSANSLGYLDDAIEAFNLALALNPKLISARIIKGLLEYRVNGQLDTKELEYITELVVSRKDKMIGRLRSLINIYLNEQDYEKVLVLLELIPDKQALDYFNQAMACEKLNIKGLAASLYKKAEELSYLSKFESINSKKLTIVLSPQAKFALRMVDFNSDRLDFADQTKTYYALPIDKIYQEIKEYINKNHYTEVAFAGNSKAVLALIDLYKRLQDDYPELTLSACASAGFIKLFPFNKEIANTPSYIYLYELICNHPYISAKIKDMQNIASNLKINLNNSFNYIYGNKSQIDVNQIDVFKNTNINMIDFDYSGHGMTIPLTIPEGKDRAWLESKYATIKLDDDLKVLDKSLLNLVDEIETIYKSGAKLTDYL